MRVDFPKLRFLVVEDNAHARRVLKALLLGFGAGAVHEAEDGEEGYEAACLLRPDIAILDWEMPGLDGLALTRRLRSLEGSPNPYLPIIMLTAHADRGRVVRARDAGVSEYLVKPVAARALYERVLAVVASQRPYLRGPRSVRPYRRYLQASERRSGP
jgi:two-component system, chemotaxis family, chemotaxis protein CheY